MNFLKRLCLLLCLLCAGCSGPDAEQFKKNKPQLLRYIESFFKKGQHDSARELINKYKRLKDPDLLKWQAKNNKAHVVKLKAELNKLKEHDYERRHEILGRLMRLDDNNNQHYVAQLQNKEKWNAFLAKQDAR